MGENVFFTKFSEISGERFDSFYNRPELVELEKVVTNVSNKKLKDFVISISSGATPKTSEESKYYTDDKENGIPFLRVQNLSTSSILNLENVKYINTETHNNMLKRSQVNENDLLIKITGVGRMAITSVPPKGFIGNTNQHMVVIKTKDRLTSEVLSTYLNLDIAEKLASRRATGGTRPALDYPALLSIPIVYNEKIVSILKSAQEQKIQKEQEAKEKLASIDKYLLGELGIEFKEKEKETLEQRVFTRKFSEVSSGRFDNAYYKHVYTEIDKLLNENILEHIELKNILTFLESGNRPSGGVSNFQDGVLSFGGEHVNSKCEIEVKNAKFIPIDYHLKNLNTETKLNDIILVKDGATTGKLGIIKEIKHVGQNINEHVFILRFNDSVISDYVLNFLNSKIGQIQIQREITGATVTGLTKEAISKVKIVLPHIETQNKIVAHIQTLRDEAKALEKEAKEVYENAKKEVEAIILQSDENEERSSYPKS